MWSLCSNSVGRRNLKQWEWKYISISMKWLGKCFQAWLWMLNLWVAKHFHLHLCSWPPLCHKRVHVPKRKTGKKFHSRKRVSKYAVKIPNLSGPSCNGISETMDWRPFHSHKWALGKRMTSPGTCWVLRGRCPVPRSPLGTAGSQTHDLESRCSQSYLEIHQFTALIHA